ncbi:hypothetical protein M3Y99_01861100 [Aphelenchoides fujianensis]|nr:hypothetical protein M3Y99_01861100 [Aphelenchoides fujianensis]
MPSSPDTHSDEDEVTFVPPAQKKLNEILEADKDDASLQRYKEKLLGAVGSEAVVIDAQNPERVIVRSITLLADHGVVSTQALPPPGNFTLKVKEGERYKLQFDFHVQREIVCGLKYLHKVSRSIVPVAKEKYMIGSYGPSKEVVSYTTPWENAPSGALARGNYKVKSKITDDDNHVYSEFSWNLEIASSW